MTYDKAGKDSFHQTFVAELTSFDRVFDMMYGVPKKFE
jgi:hypothetical protein